MAKLPKSPKPTEKTYRYHGIDLRGKKIMGEIDAFTPQMARIKLQKQGINPKSIRQQRTAWTWGKSVKSIDITLFFRQLATMLLAGITLTKALAITAQNSNNPTFVAIINTIKTDIESGSNFSKALSKHSVFSRLSIALVDAGERSGSLDAMLDRIANHQENLEALKNKLKKATQYPIAVLTVAIIVTTILLIKVVPIFSKTFADLGGQLPLATRMVVALSDTLVAHFWTMSAIITLMSGVFWLNHKTDRARRFFDNISLKLPLIKNLVKKSAAARFSRTLATTFGAGIPLLTALELSAQATAHHAFIKELMLITDKVNGGQKLSQAISHSSLFLPMTVQMISVGEESGKISQMLEKVADYYDDEVSTQIDGLTSLIEPAIIVILGVIVGGVVVAMYLPIFQIGMNTP